MPDAVLAALLAVLPGAPLPLPATASADALPRIAAAEPQEPARGSTRWFDWEAPQDIVAEVRPMTLLADEELQRILDWLEIESAPRGTIVWVESREDLEQELGFDAPDWFAAVTQPAQGRIVVALRAAPDRSSLLQTFRHELVHWAMLGLGEEAWARLPAWFHEGVAETWADQRVLAGMGVPLGWRAFTGDLPLLSDFREEFGDEPYRAAEGYALAHAFVQRLVRRHGRELLPGMMDDLAAGRSLEESLVARTGLASVTHEQALRAELSSVGRLLGEVYPQFFLLLALFTVAVFPFVLRARRRRRAELTAQWGESDSDDALDADDGQADDRWLNLK